MAFDYDDILTGIWRTLSRGVADAKHDWHWPVLGTIQTAPEGLQSCSRIVVLRAFDASTRLIEIHSDSRAQKIAQLQLGSESGTGSDTQSGSASLLFYDARSRTQVRVQATASVAIDNAISQAAWNKLPEHGRTQYLGLNAPGTALSEAPQGEALVLGTKAHFAVIHLTIESIDWLVLAREGHQRARFVWDKNTGKHATYPLVP